MSPACVSFVSAMLIRDRQQRPSAKQLLQHPIVITYLRTLLPAQQQLAAAALATSAAPSDSVSSLHGTSAMPLTRTLGHQPLRLQEEESKGNVRIRR